MQVRTQFVLFFVGIALFAACVAAFQAIDRPWYSRGAWEPCDSPAPLVNGRMGTTMRRECKHANPLDPSFGRKFCEYAWTRADGEMLSTRELAGIVENAMRKLPMFADKIDSWHPDPVSRRGGQVIEIHYLPFDLTLVSIDPVVVIGQQERAEREDDPRGAARSAVVELRLTALSNTIQIGPPLRRTEEFWWFSVGQTADLHREHVDGGPIALSGTGLIVTPSADELVVSAVE